MKTKLLAKLLPVAVIISTVFISGLSCGTANAQWPNNTYGNRNQWEVEVGTRILDRPTTDLNFGIVTTEPSGVTIFNTMDAADLDASIGSDFRFSKQTCYDGTWEVRGTFNRWENQESRNGNLSAPVFTPAILPNDTFLAGFDYEYGSDLFSLELNYKRAVRPGMTLMIGPRYVDMQEVTLVASRFLNSNPVLSAFRLDLDTFTKTDNHMPGLGFGMEIRRPLIRELFFVGSIKGAALANFASTSTSTFSTLVGNQPQETVLFDDSETQLAGIGEFSLRLHYDIAPGTVSCYAGYEAIWIDGVALAPAQLLETLTPPIELNTSSTAFAHGLVLGLMARF